MMIKRSPSRNHRSKGVKVKRVLQFILLLGICFWLIYQVKHSHDKKKEFDKKDASIGTRTPYKFGRKDLPLVKDEVTQNEKHEDEEEDESIVEDEDKHEHNEHEEEGNERETEENEEKENNEVRVEGEEEQSEEEIKAEEMEDDIRRAQNDDTDEDDQDDSAAVDTDHDVEFDDVERVKEKEKEFNEKENESSKDDEKEGSVENHNSREAREENYKGDDASSAVTHDTPSTNTETETVTLGNSNVELEMSMLKSESKADHTEEINRNQPSSDFKITKTELTVGTPSNATSGEEIGNNSLSNTINSSHLNNTTMTYPESHSEAGNNLTVVIPVGSHNMTGTGADTSSEKNKMVTFSESIQAQNDTANTTVNGDENRVSEENLPDSNSTVPVKIEISDAGAGAGESSNVEGGALVEKMKKNLASNETESKGNTETSETNKTQNILNSKSDATKDEELKSDGQTGETSYSSSVIKTSDSDILKDVTEVRTDLDTLPRIRNEGDNGNASAAN